MTATRRDMRGCSRIITRSCPRRRNNNRLAASLERALPAPLSPEAGERGERDALCWRVTAKRGVGVMRPLFVVALLFLSASSALAADAWHLPGWQGRAVVEIPKPSK